MLLPLIAFLTLLSSVAPALAEPTRDIPRSLPDISTVEQQAKEIADRIGMATEQGKKLVDRPQIISAIQRANGIADNDLAEQRERLLRDMGLSDVNGRVYIFVSFSMPLELLRAYADDAHRVGGILVLRGITEGKTVPEFIKTDLVKLVNPVGRDVPVQIDPRLFDAFNIETVPSIVFTVNNSLDLCSSLVRRTGKTVEGVFTYDACQQAPEGTYWKVAGAVTTLWAVEQFAQDGAPVEAQLEAFRLSPLRVSGVEQRGLSESDWTATADELIKRSAQRFMDIYGPEPSASAK